jgi:hypothetical protein
MSKKRSTRHSRIYRRIIWTCTWYVRYALDEYLLIDGKIHWPISFAHTNDTFQPLDPVTKRFRLVDIPIGDTWAAMEKLVRAGKIRSIGVSNFTIEKMEELLKTAEIPPAVNQIEAHPYLLQPKLFQYLKENVRLTNPLQWHTHLVDYLPEYSTCRL